MADEKLSKYEFCDLMKPTLSNVLTAHGFDIASAGHSELIDGVLQPLMTYIKSLSRLKQQYEGKELPDISSVDEGFAQRYTDVVNDHHNNKLSSADSETVDKLREYLLIVACEEAARQYDRLNQVNQPNNTVSLTEFKTTPSSRKIGEE